MTIKKYKTIILALCLALCLIFLAGCSNNDSSSKATAKEEIPVPQAPEFSLRGGINFETTKQEILDYEKSNAKDIRQNPEASSLYNYYTNNCIVAEDVSYAGYDNCRVIYFFDNNDKLISILYNVRFYGEDGAKSVPDAYTRLDDALNEKYGSIIENPISFSKDSNAIGVYDFVEGLNIFGSMKQFKQRLFDIGTAFVEIEIANVEYMDSEAMSGVYGDFKKADIRSVSISYTKIANEIVHELYKQAEDAQNALDSDL